MATTVRKGPVDVVDEDDLGIFSHAKSRIGSHISETAVGRYVPTDAASWVLTFCEVRRIMPKMVPLCLRVEVEEGSVGSSVAVGDGVFSGGGGRSLVWEGEREEDEVRLVVVVVVVVVGDFSSGMSLIWLVPGGLSLKICTVSVAEETQRRVEAALKAML